MKKLDRGFTWKISVRFIFCLQGTLNGNQSNWICDMSTRGFPNWNFIIYIQCTADGSNPWLLIHFYYSHVIRIFSRSIYCFLMSLLDRVGCVGHIFTWATWVKIFFTWVAWVKYIFACVKFFSLRLCVDQKFLCGSKIFVWVKFFFALVNFYVLDEIILLYYN